VESFNNTTNGTVATPPYYMIAFAVGKTPVTTFIGADKNNLNWTVTEPAGESRYFCRFNLWLMTSQDPSSFSVSLMQMGVLVVSNPVCSLSTVNSHTPLVGWQKNSTNASQEGMNTQCVTTPTLTPAFTITSNVTGDLETCQPWGLTVNGGVPPYIVTLGALGSPVVMNVSMPLGDNMYTFINRAAPNGQLIGTFVFRFLLSHFLINISCRRRQ
jgi:hypothetical protein